jgi:hypothetical protein
LEQLRGGLMDAGRNRMSVLKADEENFNLTCTRSLDHYQQGTLRSP